MTDEEFDVIKAAVQQWRRMGSRHDDAEFYGLAWEIMEESRKKFDAARGKWLPYMRKMVVYGLSREHRRCAQRGATVEFNPEYHGTISGNEQIDLLIEQLTDEELQTFRKGFNEWREQKATERSLRTKTNRWVRVQDPPRRKS